MAAIDFAGWAAVEWECSLKHPQDGAVEGAPFVPDHIIRVTQRALRDALGSFLIGFDEAIFRHDDLVSVLKLEFKVFAFDSDKDGLQRLAVCARPGSRL